MRHHYLLPPSTFLGGFSLWSETARDDDLAECISTGGWELSFTREGLKVTVTVKLMLAVNIS